MLAMALKPFGERSDEIAGGVVDETCQGAFVEDPGHHVFDRIWRPDVAFDRGDARVVRLGELTRRFCDHRAAPAADVHLGAKLGVFAGYLTTQSRAATGHQNALALSRSARKIVMPFPLDPTVCAPTGSGGWSACSARFRSRGRRRFLPPRTDSPPEHRSGRTP